jgi:hypothetical protein
MKKFITLILIIAFGITATLQAQTKKGDKVLGYVIDNSGKKIEGNIIISDWADSQISVKFFKKGSSKKVTYKPNQLEGYAYQQTVVDCTGKKEKNWIEYDTRKADRPSRMFGPTTVFMNKEVSKGHYRLYCYYIEVRNDVKNPYTYSFFIENNDGDFVKVDEENFDAQAKKLFKGYNAMTSKVGKKGFSLKNLDRMVEDYNYWVVNQHDTNEYRVAMKN